MRQLALDQSSGALSFLRGPELSCLHDGILVRTSFSVVSSGTEGSKVTLASKPLWEKARERPDQVARVLESVRSEGVVATVQKVRERLAAPQPLGYSLSGIVTAVGDRCEGFHIGMLVACGGASACHAEMVSVPRNLAVPVPEGVPLEDACFATVASVALHGVRTGVVAIGDRALVIGLGLIGQLAARLCATAGAHVFGIDPRADRVQLALESGVERADTALDSSAARQVRDWSGGRGADVVLITAGGADNQPLILAGAAARDRARVVVVGAVGLDVPREAFYEKELSLVVSRSYGPGRYDAAFEEKGFAYPVGFIPWTERRNMEEILALLASGRLSLDGMRGVRVPFERAPEAYELLGGKAGRSPITAVLEYEGGLRSDGGDPASAAATGGDADVHQLVASTDRTTAPHAPSPAAHTPLPLEISFIGMGSFASSYLLPAVKSVEGVRLARVVTSTALKAETARSRGGFQSATTNADEAIGAPDAKIIFIATRHDSHARYAEAALKAGRAVFVEKPLALTSIELERISQVIRATHGRLMVGFNRRFAPATQWTLEALGPNRAGLRFLYRVNAGHLPENHWILDPEIGGGRLLGEGCHFLDLACFAAQSAPLEVHARALDHATGAAGPQSFRIEIAFANGATAGIEYLSGGDPSLPKERIEIHRSGTSVVIDDFRSVSAHRDGRRRTKRWGACDKGHRAEVRAFLEAVRSGAPTPIPEEESIRTTALTLAAARSIRESRPLRREEW